MLGGLGALAGLLLGTVTGVLSLPLPEEHLFGQRIGAVRVFPLALIGIACLAVVTSVLAALIPAFVAARQDPVAGLGGRRGVAPTAR